MNKIRNNNEKVYTNNNKIAKCYVGLQVLGLFTRAMSILQQLLLYQFLYKLLVLKTFNEEICG